MSLKPIDLQILYSQLNNVSKEQSSIKEAAYLAREAEVQKVVNESLNKGHKVEKTPDLEHGVVDIKDDDPSSKEFENDNIDKQEEKDINVSNSQDDKDSYDDPNLGNNLDISG